MAHRILYGTCGHVVGQCRCPSKEKVRVDVNYLCMACTDKRRQEAADMMDRLQPCAVLIPSEDEIEALHDQWRHTLDYQTQLRVNRGNSLIPYIAGYKQGRASDA